MKSAIVADLSHNALVEVTGDDATSFLHGQFTSDVESLPVGAAQWSGWCSAKGRLLASFLLLRRADGYLLMLPREITPDFVKRLGMFVLRAKVKIADASERYGRLGFAGKTAEVIVAHHFGHAPDPLRSVDTERGTCITLDPERYVIVAPVAVAQQTFHLLEDNADPVEQDAWEATMIHAGIPTIVAATREAFVPQMVNFDVIGAVSFRKGCYPGQEIVARTQYRGILKRRMALAHVGPGPAPAAGQSVYATSFGEQAAGQVVNASPAPDGGTDFLVVAQIESLRNRDLHLDSPSGRPIEIRSHPPIEAA